MKKRNISILFAAMPLAACGSVDAGHVGIWNNFGQIGQQVAQPGMHGLNPITTSLENMSVQDVPMTGETAIYTRDLQQATVKYNVVTSLNPAFAVQMRTSVGLEWRDKLLPSLIEAAIKDVFGQFNATDAVAQRGTMQQRMIAVVRQRLQQRGVNVSAFQLTNIDYSDAFESAVEQAQVATQQAIAARNQTVRIEELARQRVITARSEAEALTLQANAITSNPAIVQLRAIEKWNGQLPGQMMGGAVPFINVTR